MNITKKQLNTSQKQAVTHDSGPAILIAGAGTGKTTVITQRIASIIDSKKAKPEQILAVTFTEKAAYEMLERVDKLLPLGYSDLWIHTFHGFCERILKDYAIDIGLSNDFKILDNTSAWLLVRENLDKFNLDYYQPLGSPTRFIHSLLTHFSRCKDEVIYPEDYLKYAEEVHLNTDQTGDREEVEQESLRIREVANAYHVYQQLLLDSNALDFGDLINYTLKLFKKRPGIIKKFREQFKYILVDEFQDTNWAQYELIKLLAAPKNNLMVVGDDDQAIYKFRGAAVSNILSFKKDYKGLTEIFLTDNYRSGQTILDTAYNFIQLNNPDRLEYQLKKGLSKKLKSHSTNKGKVEVLSYVDKNSEIDGILNKIQEIRKKDKDAIWSDFAILVRANDQAQGFVAMMRKKGFPHQFMASRGLYSQDIVLDIIAYLKLLDNYHESDAMLRILSLPIFNLKPASIINLNHLATKKSWSLYFTLKAYNSYIKLPDSDNKVITRILEQVDKHTELAKEQTVSQVVYTWLEDSGYLQTLGLEDSQYNQEQIQFINQFYKKIRDWEETAVGEASVHNFLNLMKMELESGDQGAMQYDKEAGPDVIKVMTIHGAKGLEFKYVFVANLVHLRFPSIERKDPITMPEEFIKESLPKGDAHLQEERRLFYVALTRAKQAVYLTWAKDYGGVTERKPSRFIQEAKLAVKSTQAVKEPKAVVQKKQAVKYSLPKIFSFSQLQSYEICPRQFFYRYIVKVPFKGSASFSFGNTMHHTLQKFYQLIIDRSSGGQDNLFDKSKKISYPTEKELLKLYEENWEDDWYPSSEDKEKYRQDGVKILKEYYNIHKGNWTVPVFLEKGFTIKIAGHSVRGRIDRIDQQDSKWHIIDYKTDQSPKKALRPANKRQLLFYQIASEEVFNTRVDNLSFYYLKNNSELSFVGTKEEIAKVKDWASKIIDKILAQDFKPKANHNCEYCDGKSTRHFVEQNK